jgi:hypothetical protein
MDMTAATLDGDSGKSTAVAIMLNSYGDELRQMLENDKPLLAMEPDQSAKLAALRDAVQESLFKIRGIANALRCDREVLAGALDDEVELLAAALEGSAQ